MSSPPPLSAASGSSTDLFKSSINEYLENLPEAVHSQLYRSPETCLAIFRLLPSLAKFYIMTLLFQENAVPYSDLNRWIKQNTSSTSASHHRNPSKIYQTNSLKRLKALNLTKDIRKEIRHPQTKELTKIILVQLNPIFKHSFRNALTGVRPEKDEDSEMTDVAVKPEEEESASREGSDEPQDANGLNAMFSDDEVISVDFLDNYCLSKWENILHFMVGSEIPELPSIGVLTLLRHSGLMELESDRKKREMNEGSPTEELPITTSKSTPSLQTLSKLMITKHGFQFLLQDINSQIWTLLLQYLKMSENLLLNPVDVLNFIFMLGSLELGEGYPIKMLSDTQVIMLEDLIDYGLIYYPSVPENSSEKVIQNRKFYPTRLATTLTSESCNFKSASAVLDQEITAATIVKDADSSTTNDSSRGSIIIETNFKIYCYTSSPLQIAILNLFVHLKARFKNMVTGSLTRESVRHALMNGITAEQIISYLSVHAHPGMIKLAEEKLAKKLEFEAVDQQAHIQNNELEILPPTVIDQIRLWQIELDRIQATKGYLYKDFANDMEFEKLSTYGEEIGVLLWKDKLRKRFFVTDEGHNQLIEYANRVLRKGQSQGQLHGTGSTPTASTPTPGPSN